MLAAGEEELSSRGQVAHQASVQRFSGLLTFSPQATGGGGGNNNNNPALTVAAGTMLCKPHYIITSCGWCADGEMEGPGEEDTQNQDYQPVAVAEPGCMLRAWSTTGRLAPSGSPEQVQGSCCGVPSPGASSSYCPLCPPALPTVSATPGTLMPCGNLIWLVLPSKETSR